jgi:hypothetical protein
VVSFGIAMWLPRGQSGHSDECHLLKPKAPSFLRFTVSGRGNEMPVAFRFRSYCLIFVVCFILVFGGALRIYLDCCSSTIPQYRAPSQDIVNQTFSNSHQITSSIKTSQTAKRHIRDFQTWLIPTHPKAVNHQHRQTPASIPSAPLPKASTSETPIANTLLTVFPAQKDRIHST